MLTIRHAPTHIKRLRHFPQVLAFDFVQFSDIDNGARWAYNLARNFKGGAKNGIENK